MAIWLWLLAAIAAVGDGSNRTIVHFSADNCPACKVIQPIIDELRSEGWSVRSIDAEKNRSIVDRFHVRAYPTLIVLVNGIEVDRIVGSQGKADLKKRLTGTKSPHRESTLAQNASGDLPKSDARTLYGPNHPLSKLKHASDASLGSSAKASVSESRLPTIGVNHPYYSRLKKTPIASVDVPSAKLLPTPKPKRVPSGSRLADSPSAIAATVRIRVDYAERESVGTGTIIETADNKAIVLTCGHLFRNSETKHPVTVELFQDGKTVKLRASLVAFRNDELDLGFVQFHSSNPGAKVPLRPRNEPLQEHAPVFSLGCDGGDDPSRRDSVITKLNRYLGPANIEIDGAPVQGRSGGGLFDARGRLIGVCVAAEEELDEGIFVGPEAIYEQLSKLGLSHLFE